MFIVNKQVILIMFFMVQYYNVSIINNQSKFNVINHLTANIYINLLKSIKFYFISGYMISCMFINIYIYFIPEFVGEFKS